VSQEIPFSFLYRNERTATCSWIVFVLCFCLTFSFLYRNERTATQWSSQSYLLRASTFSFLYRNERTATGVKDADELKTKLFQFPLSERTNCNLFQIYVTHAASALSVSSIGTNELQRTRMKHLNISPDSFSFLYRNERTATVWSDCFFCRCFDLSVSSIGTNELQPDYLNALRDVPLLSVSSIGTNELQPHCYALVYVRA